MSPLFIRMAIAYHVSPAPQTCFEKGTWTSRASEECRELLRHERMIDANDEPTEKLRFWVDHLCSIPFPVETYRIPGGAQ